MAIEEIEISQLELAGDLAPDMVLPVETTTDTKATTLQAIKNWLSSFFVGKNGDETIKGTKTLDKNPILNSSTANMVAIIDSEKKLVSDSNISITELGYLNGVTSNLQTQVNGRANTDLSNVASNIDYVVESYTNGSDWYRVYKSGWIEQGMIITATNQGATKNWLKSFKDTNYSIAIACLQGKVDISKADHWAVKSTNSIKAYKYDNTKMNIVAKGF